MNKHQLASKIWESANKLRSKIEANEYKDYILGFIFYKFLSDKEERFLRKDGWEDDDFKELTEKNSDTVEYCRRQLGYFIAYDNLFSTWMKKGKDFNVSNVTDALSAFNRIPSTGNLLKARNSTLVMLITELHPKARLTTPFCFMTFSI